MSEAGPPQGNLFAAAVRRRADGGSAQPENAPTAPADIAAEAGQATSIGAPAAVSPCLWIGAPERAAIARLIERARGAVRVRNVGAETGRIDTIALPSGFKVGYCVEREPDGLAHHLAVGTDQPSEPSPVALTALLGYFGFSAVRLAELDARWIVDIGFGRCQVHLVERLAGFELPAIAASTAPGYLGDFIADPEADEDQC